MTKNDGIKIAVTDFKLEDERVRATFNFSHAGSHSRLNCEVFMHSNKDASFTDLESHAIRIFQVVLKDALASIESYS